MYTNIMLSISQILLYNINGEQHIPRFSHFIPSAERNLKMNGNYEKRGYLNSHFRLFHLTDTQPAEYEYHYHDFDKIIIFIKGNVQYTVEGKSYQLQPYDIVLVNRHDIHKLHVSGGTPYERIVVYISPGFIDTYRAEDYDLSYCFQKAKREHTDVLRTQSVSKSALVRSVNRLENSFDDTAFANTLYREVLFLEFMIHLNRAAVSDRLDFLDTDSCNTKVVDILQYINSHLTSDLTIEQLSSAFFISKYYMMRLFKEETGYTIGNYISYRRLLLARKRIQDGAPVTQACFDCGFKNYSTFSRAYKNLFGESPRQTLKSSGSTHG